MAACPTGAVRGDGSLDLKRCIQWYASGKEAAVPPAVAEKWGRRFYGCTCCQDACVHNRRPIRGVETVRGFLPAALNLEELLARSDEEIRARFKGTAMGLSWLGPGAIRRNARYALGATL
jgi:epoxyqueuosine reductase